jgi:rRNA processing protein Gar1
MGRDYRRRPQTKRRFHQTQGDAPETVDDLAHAAQFAIFPNSAVANTSLIESGDPTKKKEDDNEIEVGDEEEEDDDSDASIADAAPNENGGQHDDDAAESESDDDESDDESDDDLAEALQRMEQASAKDEANLNSAASNPPKTENEVDGYKIPIQELESQLQIQLTVQEGTITTTTNNSMDVSMNEVSLAGKIKNYMMLDRTVVIESITNSSPGLQQRALDEGSLLVIKKPDNTDDDKDASTASWIPLGRIFEVFGPVSQPLYTIRLPSPPNNQKKKSSANRSSKKNPKKKVSLNDNEQTEESEAKINTHQDDNETTTMNNKKSNEGNIVDDTTVKIESPKEGGESITMGEEASDPEEKNSVIQSPSSPTPCQTTIQETSDVRENEDATLSWPSKIVGKSLPTQEKEAVESKTENATPNNDEHKVPIIDPWAVDGEYAKLLSQHKDIQVYYIEDEAKLIDTGLVLRISAKGCDASNIYDEEIIDSNEAYFSDDEKEREAKNKRKGRKKTQERNNDNNRQQKHPPRSGNFHQQQFQHNAVSIGFSNTSAIGHHARPSPPPPPPPPPQNYGYGQRAGSLPQGFHRVTQQQMPHGGFQQQQQPLYQYPAQSSFRGQAQASIPPPPPPPQMHSQPNPYQRTAPPSYPPQAPSSMRPPPTPRNPNEPPAYQY